MKKVFVYLLLLVFSGAAIAADYKGELLDANVHRWVAGQKK